MRHGDTTAIEWWTVLHDQVLAVHRSEQEAIAHAELHGATVRRVEWKHGGKSK